MCTIYATNTLAIMTSTPGQYQEFKLQGNPGSATNITGEIIASKLTLGGTSTINMNLSSAAAYTIRQVALVQ